MNDPEIRMLVRKARQTRRVRGAKACDECGADVQLKLLPDGRVVCYACLQAARGHPKTEDDHVAEEANLGGFKAALLLNDHRTITEYRSRLGVDDWPNADGDWRLLVAHVVAGLASYLFLIAAWVVDFVAAEATGRAARPFPIVP